MATVSNLNIDADSDYSQTVTINTEDSNGNLIPLDLTGYVASSQIRKTYGSSTSTDFTIVFDADRTSGQVILSLTDTQTNTLKEGRYVWDLVITKANGERARAIEGIVTINPSVSRSI